MQYLRDVVDTDKDAHGDDSTPFDSLFKGCYEVTGILSTLQFLFYLQVFFWNMSKNRIGEKWFKLKQILDEHT